ncbi:hypothetical protein [Flectobacillus major]|uniref:hypothetical protein n=1 Tax=Flectobacillus major TaxID=103 RepID=UPI000403BAA0|nr:hypothetical protein [Flectobacillus major]
MNLFTKQQLYLLKHEIISQINLSITEKPTYNSIVENENTPEAFDVLEQDSTLAHQDFY